MKFLYLLICLTACTSAFALTFNEAIKNLEKHESIESITGKSKASLEEAKLESSWGDPMFKIAAKNYPKDTLDNDQTPMTGIEFGVSQKISLTTKYGNIEDAYKSLAKAYQYEADEKKEALVKALWEILILKRKITQELAILNENKVWISKILKVSKKLYANGKTSQQAILDIQIRNSEIDSEISNRTFELSQMKDNIKYLVGSSEIKNSSIPWAILENNSSTVKDNRDLSLKEKLKAKEFDLTASKLNYVPDVTVSLGLTKRSDIDGKGDFVGASLSFPLPFSTTQYSKLGKAVQEKYRAAKEYTNYKKIKKRDVSLSQKEIQKIESEINIINNKTIKFATNSRSITSTSYRLGNSSYVELSQSELKLQNILMQKIMLEAKRDMKKIALKYILGEPLSE